MSRNLGRTTCPRCGSRVALVGDVYSPSADYPNQRDADAECTVCKVQLIARITYGTHIGDLMYRHSINDVPRPEDLPYVGEITILRVVTINGTTISRIEIDADGDEIHEDEIEWD